MTAVSPVRPATVAAPPRVPIRWALLAGALLLGVQGAVLLATDRSVRDVLLPGHLVLIVAFGLVFCLGAVTVAGFAAGAAAAGLVVLQPDTLLPLLGGAALLALGCGLAPGWTRVETWQAAQSRPLSTEQEAAATPQADRSRGRRLRDQWRSDRVLAAFLVLAFHPVLAAFALWFTDWMQRR
ncbi:MULTISPECIES: hypothetical protein [unclassified Modestobacter]|uniref:hypothetical protein n=1 Tax=unclassified Modestobacter TaxID=2643866 RepID=UPI0022AAE803|nr:MULTISPECIES: hypothetical protein [unclassified Modestobacter]MCZ2824381.1 hypothetical protein [Modestobacter sp. VKM Ac-2981]MCZ2854091.1 hypothetical protein [Modestobacter sp. VKM Ac-2982]